LNFCASYLRENPNKGLQAGVEGGGNGKIHLQATAVFDFTVYHTKKMGGSGEVKVSVARKS